MHKEVYLSKIDQQPLHIVQRLDLVPLIPASEQGRADLVDPNEGLQVAVINQDAGKKYAAHRHLPRAREIPQTQESWVVVSGKVRVSIFDLDGKLLEKTVIGAGDCSITLRGGHGYEILKDNTIVFEFKLGSFSAVGDKEYLK